MSQSGTDFLTGSSPVDGSSNSSLSLEAPLSTHASDSPFYHVADSQKSNNTANDASLSSVGSGLDLLSSNPSSISRKSSGKGSPPHPPSSSSSSNNSTIADMDFSSLNSGNRNLPHSSALAVITATSAAFLESAHPSSATVKNQQQRHGDEDLLPLSAKDNSFSASDTSVSVSEPNTPHQTKLTKRTSSTNNAIESVNTKLAAAASSPENVSSPTTAPIISLAANGSMPKLNVNTSSDNPESSPPAAAASATTTTTGAASTTTNASSKSAAGTAAANAPTSAPAAGSNPAQSRGIFNRLFNPFGGGVAAAPALAGDSAKASPPPVGSGKNSGAEHAAALPPAGAPSPAPPGGAPAATTASTPNALQQNPSPIPVVIPKSYSYQDFAAKMKLPAAQDLVKSLKNYVKLVQSTEWYSKNIPTPTDASQPQLASYGPEFDKIKTEYNEVIASIMKTIRVKHPLWKGCSEEELDNACESIEKFLTSKLYEKFFGLFQGDRTKDQALTQKLFILHTWVQPSHLDLPAYCCADVSIWDHPAEELRNMDKFKSPRDKLVCLLNCCHIINNILKRAKVKANAEKAEALETKRKQRQAEKERLEKEKANEVAAAVAADPASTTATATTPSQSPEASPKSSPSASLSKRNSLDDIFTPSSSPSADDFFPALLYVLVHAQAPHLYLNLVYISLCRFETKLSGGEAAYWYTNLASAIAFIESCNEKSFSFSKDKEKNATVAKKEYERLMEAGLVSWNELKAKEEAERKAAAEAEAAAAAAAEEKRKADKEAAANAEATAAAIAAAAAASASPAHSDTASIDLLNSPAHLLHNHGGVSANGGLPPPCVACLHLSHRRIPTHFLEREFSSLTMGEMQDVVREYKELIFVLQGWQEANSHREMKNMPLPAKGSSTNADESEFGVNLTGADANSAAPSNAAVAASSNGLPSKDPNLTSAATASQSRGWLTGNFLGLGRAAK